MRSVGFEPGAAVAGEHCVTGVKPTAREQITRATEAVEVALADTLTPFHFAERQDPPRLGRCRGREIPADLREMRPSTCDENRAISTSERAQAAQYLGNAERLGDGV